jgi:hypothetical protein
MTVDAYVRELARELGLRTPHTRRILVEVEDHLRESARELGEDEALARFGSPRTVAATFAGDAARRLTRWTSWAVGASILATLAAYGAIENGAPPAPWQSADSAPDYLVWKLWLAQRLILVGFVAGAIAVAWAHLRPDRARGALACCAAALGALASAGVLSAIESFQRAAVYRELGVADTPVDLAIAGVVLVQLLPTLAGVALAARTAAWLHVSTR